ncbi:MAG: amidohydrolase family protein, partial [Longimicrobiales bacterium]|nr:amidohydrolase family protein [Longimicrobiales bacterium]
MRRFLSTPFSFLRIATLVLTTSALLPASGISTSTAAWYAGAVVVAAQDAPAPYDWLIRGGSVVDGTGSPARSAEILLRDERIVHIGAVDPDTVQVERVFDARGLVVAPGFIDLHAHGDPTDDPSFQNFLAQGVTTIVLGQDGSSPEARGFTEYLQAVEAARPSVNLAYLVGHNTIRRESGVGFGDPDAPGLERMANLVDRAMAAGAFGLSTGLEYSPGGRAGPDELAAIAGPVGERGGVVMSHLRSEDEGRVLAAVEELLEQGRRSGAGVHVSHMKIVLGDDPGRARRILDVMAGARDSGMQVTGDVYPYLASFTGISLLFPDWALAPNEYATVVRNRGDELAAYLRRRVESRNGPEATLFGSGPWSGRTLADVAEEQERPFEDILVELGPGGARAAYFVMDADVMTTFLIDPFVAVASDGSPTMAHPRGYGAFARVLHHHVAEREILTLEEAVRKMTSLPAGILDLDDETRVDVPVGVLREGWAADVVAFDP